MSTKTFKPGPGYPVTDFIHVPRELRSTYEEARALESRLWVQLAAAYSDRDELATALENVMARLHGSTEAANALLERIRGEG